MERKRPPGAIAARRVTRVLAAALVASCLAGRALAADPTPAQANQAAKDAAAALPAAKSWVTLPQQQDKFGPYNPGANELKFQGGKGNATPDGTARVTGCLSGTDPECLAIQVLRQGRSNPSALVPLTSPQITGRNLVVGDPAGTTGVDPEATAQVVNNVQCKTITTTTPEVRELTTCDATVPNASSTCFIGALVEVDPDWVYKCMYRTASNADSICSVGQVVVVDKTTTYQCVEQLRTMNASTCTVGQVVEVRSTTEYQCLVRTRNVGDASCSVGQVVVLDPNYQYQCTDNPNQTTSNECRRKLTVACSDLTDGCSAGGIVLGTVAGDVTASLTDAGAGNWTLHLGTIGDIYWNSCSSIFSRSMTFTVASVAQLSQFLLNYAQFDDYMLVKLNGVTVYNGPDGGNTLRVATGRPGSVCTSSNVPGLVLASLNPPPGFVCSKFGALDRRTNWVFNPGVDLRPFLVDGTNTLEFHVFACGGGEGNIDITTRAYSPQTCSDTWDQSACQAFINRL